MNIDEATIEVEITSQMLRTVYNERKLFLEERIEKSEKIGKTFMNCFVIGIFVNFIFSFHFYIKLIIWLCCIISFYFAGRCARAKKELDEDLPEFLQEVEQKEREDSWDKSFYEPVHEVGWK